LIEVSRVAEFNNSDNDIVAVPFGDIANSLNLWLGEQSRWVQFDQILCLPLHETVMVRLQYRYPGSQRKRTPHMRAKVVPGVTRKDVESQLKAEKDQDVVVAHSDIVPRGDGTYFSVAFFRTMVKRIAVPIHGDLRGAVNKWLSNGSNRTIVVNSLTARTWCREVIVEIGYSPTGSNRDLPLQCEVYSGHPLDVYLKVHAFVHNMVQCRRVASVISAEDRSHVFGIVLYEDVADPSSVGSGT
jgi:hypothetical protein